MIASRVGFTSRVVPVALALLLAATADTARPCGGFFCQFVPIDQAGEQIIFRQDGDTVTAVVLIQYVGDSSDFSWVVPVPGIPELSTGSDMVFAPLELATRPQFTLEVTGADCPSGPFPDLQGNFDSIGGGSAEDDDGVEVLEQLFVGPFDVQIVTSEDAEALATWLVSHGYDLTDRGRELIAPYVEEGMNFVAMRLRQDHGVGDIQPLIMRYHTEKPMVPIRLTAVAAQPDMGIIVWLLGPARAVPLNYLHVTPNYTKLNWYFGTFVAYASYQDLITEAMNEAGGQGFATDFAGRGLDVLSQLPTVEAVTGEIVAISQTANDASFVAQTARSFVLPQQKVLEILHRNLPLADGEQDYIYSVEELVAQKFTPQNLAAARAAILADLDEEVVQPLAATLAVFEGDLYLSRLYTTLSPEEMTLDPTFSFNSDLGDQPLERVAELHLDCNRWSLTLGAGTGREGQRVIEGTGYPFFGPAPTIAQDSLFLSQRLQVDGLGEVVTQKTFAVAQVAVQQQNGLRLCGSGSASCGAGTGFGLMLTMLGLRTMRVRRSLR